MQATRSRRTTAYSTYGVSLIYPYMLANLSDRVVDMWSEPRAPSPQNSLGTAEMSFQILSVYIEKAVWYGSSPDQLYYDYVAEHDVIADLEVTCTDVGAARCMARTGLGVRLRDYGPAPNDIPHFQKGFLSHYEVMGAFPVVYVRITGSTIISKAGQILNMHFATSQYHDMIYREEATHENQWHGVITNMAGGLPPFHDGDLPLLEANVIQEMVAFGGAYDAANQTVQFVGRTLAYVREIVNDALRHEFERVKECTESWGRRCLKEKTAKEWVGWREAYTYRCAYPTCLQNPAQDCP